MIKTGVGRHKVVDPCDRRPVHRVMAELHIDSRGASIGSMVIAEQVVFGGKEPAGPERVALRGQIQQHFDEVLRRGTLTTEDSAEFDAALQRLLAGRGQWCEVSGGCVASIEVDIDGLAELRLPLELLRPASESGTVVVRCGLAETSTVSEGPRAHPEGGRMVLATADAGGPVPDAAVLGAVEDVCRAGLHRASGSVGDLRRGAFDPAHDHCPQVSRSALREALAPNEDRPGAAVLQLVCHVRNGGLCLHDDAGDEVIVGAESFAAMLAPFTAHLRLVVLVPLAESHEGDPGRAVVDVAIALHRRGLAAVVAPRVPLPVAAVPRLTTAWLGALLGTARRPPTSLEVAVCRACEVLSTHDGLAHLGLRLYARAADGADTRPIVIRPYRGLLSFEPEHRRFFVGRKRETVRVIERLAELRAQGQPSLVLLVGASGVGKSSLAKAGVVPKLVDEGFTPILTRPAQHSAEQLGTVLEGVDGEQRLVVVDQLEEVFTETQTHQEAAEYLRRLWSLAEQDGVVVLATLRIDALDLGGEIRVGAQGERTLEELVLGTHGIFVPHLRADSLREVITEPAQQVGLVVDPGLVERLCAEALAEPGALPMLELVLDHLWDQRQGHELVSNAYEDGLAGTLAKYAQDTLGALSLAQRQQAERILVRIATGPVVELATWRRRSTVAALCPHREERRVDFEVALTALIDARLVVRGELRGEPTRTEEASSHMADAAESVELAHELLLRQWGDLRRWIDEATPRLPAIQDLERWVGEWSERGTLLTETQIAYVDAKLSPEDDDLSGTMLELLGSSRRGVRKRRWLRRALFAGVGAVAIAFAALSWWAIGQRDEARAQTKVAEQQRSEAQTQTHTAEQQTALATQRLSEANELARALIFDLLPELERHPQVRLIGKQILEELQQMQQTLRTSDDDIDVQWNIGAAHIRRGDEALHSDDIDVARREYEAANTIAKRFVTSGPWADEARRFLSISLNKLGDVEVQAGDLAAARDLLQRGLDITEELAKADPQSAQAQHDLSVSLTSLGEVEVQAGNLAVARDLFQRDLDITEGLANTAPHSAPAQRHLSVSLNKLGNVEVQAGNLTAARDLFQRCCTILKRLAKDDPQSVPAQRDLSVSLNRLGDAEVRAGNLAAARELFQRSLLLREELAKADPHSAQAQRYLAGALSDLGNVEVQAGNFAAARNLFQRSRLLHEELVKADPHSEQAQRYLSNAFGRLGEVELQLGNLTAARDLLQRSLLRHEALAKSDPHSAQAQSDLSIALENLGNLEVQAGSLATARDLLQRSLLLREALAKANPHSAQAAFDVVLSLLRLAALAQKEGDLDELRKVVVITNKHIATMDTKGQITGYHKRERVRELFRQAAESFGIEP